MLSGVWSAKQKFGLVPYLCAGLPLIGLVFLTIWALGVDKKRIVEEAREQAELHVSIIQDKVSSAYQSYIRTSDNRISFISSENKLVDPKPLYTVPEPVDWLQQLDSDQLGIFHRVESASISQNENEMDAVSTFLESDIPVGLVKYIQFEQACFDWVQGENESLLLFIDQFGNERSPTGTYYGDIGIFRMIQSDIFPSGSDIILNHISENPSFLTGHLIQQGREVSFPGIDVNVEHRWSQSQVARELFHYLKSEFLTSGLTIPNEMGWMGKQYILFRRLQGDTQTEYILLDHVSYSGFLNQLGPTIKPETLPRYFKTRVVDRDIHEHNVKGELLVANIGVTVSEFAGQRNIVSEIIVDDLTELYRGHNQRVQIFSGLVTLLVIGGVLFLVLIYRNQSQLIRLNQFQKNFVSSVSHELRAPIGSLQLLSEGLMEGRVQTNERKQEYYRLMTRECRRLGGMVSNVLTYSRMDRGQVQFHMEETDLVGLLTSVQQLMQPLAEEKETRIEMSLDSSIPDTLFVDGSKLHQALTNIVENAIKHAPSSTTISIRSYANIQSESLKPNEWVVEISDEGPGIEKENLSSIFVPFFRGGCELSRETEGVGIGLSIAKHAVEGHGGSILVINKQTGGCLFSIVIPYTKEGVVNNGS